MARRSYLQRIAEPLRGGDPVLFAVPHPAPDEARPAVTPSAPVLRRAPARAASPVAPVAESATQLPQARSAVVPANAVANGMPDAAGPPALQASFAERHAAPTQPGMRPAPPRSPEPAQPPADHAAAGSYVDPSSPNDHAAPPVADFAAVALPPREASVSPPALPLAPAGTQVAIEAEPAPRQPPSPAASMPSTGAPAPRIHIGTVEVRSAVPPPTPGPPPTASRAAPPDATPIARAYAWRFGLVQG